MIAVCHELCRSVIVFAAHCDCFACVCCVLRCAVSVFAVFVFAQSVCWVCCVCDYFVIVIIILSDTIRQGYARYSRISLKTRSVSLFLKKAINKESLGNFLV